MIIVKVGGAKNLDWDEIARDLAQVHKEEQVVFVHGASQIRDEIAEKVGSPTKTVISPSGISSVFTDSETMEVFLMAYPGLVNKQIVGSFQRHGINAVGLSGLDGRIWEGKRKDKVIVKDGKKTKMLRGNLTGRVKKVNGDLIRLLLENEYTPVICPPAISDDNTIINVDNDLAIAQMAKDLKVQKVVMLFEAPGFLKDHNDEKSLIKNVAVGQLDEYLQYADGRMKKKVIGAKEALVGGVEKVYWGDSRLDTPITRALNGEGTIIK